MPVAVNWRLAPPEMAYILDNAEAKLVLVEGEFLDHVEKMDLPRNPTLIEVNGDGRYTTYADWIADASTDDPNYPVDIDDTASQLYTSGTTGLPKGAELSNRNFDTTIEPIGEMLGLTSDSVMLHVLPMFHIGGSGVAIAGLMQRHHQRRAPRRRPRPDLRRHPRPRRHRGVHGARRCSRCSR